MKKREAQAMGKTKLEFKRNFNYSYCFLVGRFRLYVYGDENYHKIDATKYEILSGHIPAYSELFADFRNKFQATTPEIEAEFKRVIMSLSDNYKKICNDQGWFRITFDEPKYIPGILTTTNP